MAGTAAVEDWQNVGADDWADVSSSGSSVADRHNNPLNIKLGPLTKRYVDQGFAEVGEPAKDGGDFLRFKSADEGFQAGRELLASDRYADLDLDSAMRAWSGNGYGAEVSPSIGKDRAVSSLNSEELDTLMRSMAKREGYGTSGKAADDWESVAPAKASPQTAESQPAPLNLNTGKAGAAVDALARIGSEVKQAFSLKNPVLNQPLSKSLGGYTGEEAAEHLMPEHYANGGFAYDVARRTLKTAGTFLDWIQSPLGIATSMAHAASSGADMVVGPLLGAKFTTEAYTAGKEALDDMAKNGATPENVEKYLGAWTQGLFGVAAGTEGAKGKEHPYGGVQRPYNEEELKSVADAANAMKARAEEQARKAQSEADKAAAPTRPNQAARRATLTVPETNDWEEQHFTDAELEELTRPTAKPIQPEIAAKAPEVRGPEVEPPPAEEPAAETHQRGLDFSKPETVQEAPETKAARSVKEAPIREPERAATAEPAKPEPTEKPVPESVKPASAPVEPARESTLQTFHEDLGELQKHPARGNIVDAPGMPRQKYLDRLAEYLKDAPDNVKADYLDRLRKAAELHFPDEAFEAPLARVQAAEAAMANGAYNSAALNAEAARAGLREEYGKRLAADQAEKLGIDLPEEVKPKKAPKKPKGPLSYEEAQGAIDEHEAALEAKYGRDATTEMIKAQTNAQLGITKESHPELDHPKYAFTGEELARDRELYARRDAIDQAQVETNVAEIDRKFAPLIPDTKTRGRFVRDIAEADLPTALRTENNPEQWRAVGRLADKITRYISENVTKDRAETAFKIKAEIGGTADNPGVRLRMISEPGLAPSEKTLAEAQRWMRHLYPEDTPVIPGAKKVRGLSGPEPQPSTPHEKIVWESAEAEMLKWAETVRDVQDQQKKGESAMTMASNAAGKEIEEAQDAHAKAIRSLGVKEGSPLEAFDEAPEELASAIEDHGGVRSDSKKMKLFRAIRQAFRDAYERDHGDAIREYLDHATDEQRKDLLGEEAQAEPQKKSVLGETAEEGMSKLAAGRDIDQLKEGKSFDENRLLSSELFQGRGGRQKFLGTDERADQEGELEGDEGGDASFNFGESGHSPLLDDVVHALSRTMDRIREYMTIDPVPQLRKAGVEKEAIEHASARTAVPRMIHAMLSKVFPETYKNPGEMAKVMRVMVLDNILGGYDDLLSAADFARENDDEATANRLEKRAQNIADKHDLEDYDAFVKAARRDPKTVEAIRRWKQTVNPFMDQLYNEMKGMDPDTQRDGRGRVFGARVNLLAKSHEPEWLKTLTDEEAPVPAPASSLASYKNPNVRMDRFDRMAKFTAEEYSNDPAAVLAAALSNRWNEVTKRRFYNSLVEQGVASWEKPESGTINNKAVRGAPVDIPQTSKGQTRYVRQTLWLPEDLHEEFRGVLGTDMRLKMNPVGAVLTKLQLMQIADATAHLKNLHSVIANAQGTKSLLGDLARKFPGISSADAVLRIARVAHEIAVDGPAIRQELAKMAMQGMVREHYPAQGFQKITRMQDLIHSVDTASRVTMNRFYDNLVERGLAKDTFNSRRQFVQQIGEYNKRLMGPLMRAASQTGLSPFIVAGRTFNRFSRRLLTGHTGVESPTSAGAAQMRLVNLATLTTMFALPAMLNKVLTGNIHGRPGTPIGAIDFNQPEDKSRGTHKVLDLLQLYGVRRGMRATGMDSIANGIMAGKSANDIIGHAIYDATGTAAHPWLGPALGFAFSGLTGQRLDLRGGPVPEQATKMEGMGSQLVENLRVAAKNQNLLLYSPFRRAFKDVEESPGRDFVKDFLKSPMSAVGIQDRPSPAIEMARDMATHTPQTPIQKVRVQTRRQILAAYDRGDSTEARRLETEGRKAGHLTPSDLTLIRSEQRQPAIARSLRSADLGQLLDIWDVASPEERKAIRPMIATRRSSQALTATEKAELLPRANRALAGR